MSLATGAINMSLRRAASCQYSSSARLIVVSRSVPALVRRQSRHEPFVHPLCGTFNLCAGWQLLQVVRVVRYHPQVASYFAQRVLEQNRVSIQDFLLDFAETQWLRSGERRESRAAAPDLCLDLLVAFLQIAVFAGESLRDVRLAAPRSICLLRSAHLSNACFAVCSRRSSSGSTPARKSTPGLGQAFEQ